VRQERLGEWRRRDGFATGPVPAGLAVGFYMAGAMGDGGAVVAGTGTANGLFPSTSWYRPAVGSWLGLSTLGSLVPAQRTRRSLTGSEAPGTGAFATVSGIAAVAMTDAFGTVRIVASDAATGALGANGSLSGSWQTVRMAATGSYLVVFVVAGGQLDAYVMNPSVSTTWTTYAAVKTGLNATPYLDARWYGGSTITVVYRSTTNAVGFIEFNPATGAKATDTTVAGISCASTLSLLMDPEGSGVRFVASSHTTPTTRVTRCSSAGAVLTDDQVQAVASTHITGVSRNAGADWHVVYQTTANDIRTNWKTGGVVAAAARLNGLGGGVAWSASSSLESQAWAATDGTTFRLLLGLHSQITADAMDTIVEVTVPWAASDGATAASNPTPISAGPRNATPGTLLQVQAIASRRFQYVIPVQAIYEDNAGVIVRHYTLDLFDQRFLAASDVGGQPTGNVIPVGSLMMAPMEATAFLDENETWTQLGAPYPPPIPTLTPSVGAGALTTGKEYQYAWIIEQIGPGGAVGRSPQSVPALVTLTGGQNTVAVQLTAYPVGISYGSRAALYRTEGDGSLFRRIYSTLLTGMTVSYTDLLSDADISDGEPLYTAGEEENVIVPAFSHMATSDGRLWGLSREYPTEAWYSKKLRAGRLPEFTDSGIVRVADAYGDLTGVIDMDDKTVLFKESAVYFVTGEGLDDAGGGNDYAVTRVTGEMGAIPGSPTLSLGSEAYFVAKRGICRISGQGLEFIGSPVDVYLNQPQIQTPETVRSIVYSARWNEVRFVTNARVLVYNRTFGVWWTFVGALATGSPLLHSWMAGGQQWILREDGAVFVEGSTSQLKDGANDFEGFLRSQWVIPAGPEGRLRLYLARVLATRTAGGSPIYPRLSIFRDYDDDESLDFDVAELVDPDTSSIRLEGAPHVTEQVVNAFSLQVTFPGNDNTWRLERWAAVVGVKPGYQRIDTERMVR